MNLIRLLLLVSLLVTSGCGLIFRQKAEPSPPPAADTLTAAPPAPPVLPQRELIITPSASPILVDAGTPAEATLHVSWVTERRQAVELQLSPQTPRWLKAELEPSRLEPPATVILRLSVAPGTIPAGPQTLVIEASGWGLPEPERTNLLVTIHRQAGEFQHFEGGSLTMECRNVCGQVRDGQVTFYDVLPGQSCSDTQSFPESQRLGARSYPLSARGFAFGRTCQVAVVYEANGPLTFVNLGLSPALPRGIPLLTLRGAADFWLSPDNTIALARLSSVLIPYDVLTGQQLGGPCRIAGEFQPVTLSADTLRAGLCSWQIR